MHALPTLARWIAGLLAISAVVFAVAVLLEGGEAGAKSSATEQVAPEGSEAAEAAEHHETGKAAEELLGVNLESPWLVWGFVVVSLLLAALVLRLWMPAFVLAILLAVLAALLDGREVINQLGVKDAIAILAALVGLAHIAAAILAVVALTKFRAANHRALP